MGGAAIIWNKIRRVRVEGRHRADAEIESFVFHQVTYIADRIRTDEKDATMVFFIQHKLVAVLLHPLDASENSVFAERIIALEKIGIGKFAFLIVLSPDERARPVSCLAKGFVVNY